MPPSTFGAKTTAEEAGTYYAPSIKNKVVLITGASQNGLGGEAARVIAKYASLVIIAGRSKQKLDETEAVIKAETPKANIRQLVVDLGSLISVRAAAEEVLAYSETIDVLINNAAQMASPYSVIPETKFESQLGINHLGPFLFTNLILSKLSKEESRIVNVSSMGHRRSDIRYEDIGFSNGDTYEKWTAYGQAKTANMLFSKALAARGWSSFSLHPGVIWTNLLRHLTHEDQVAVGFITPEGVKLTDGTGTYTWKSIEEGTATHIVAAFDEEIKLNSGSYLSDAQIADDIALPYALDPISAEKLWKLSEEMVGEKF